MINNHILFCHLTDVSVVTPVLRKRNITVNDLNICSHLRSQFGKTGTIKVNKGAKIRNGYNQVLHLTQDTNGKVTNSQLDTTNESQEVNPFPSR